MAPTGYVEVEQTQGSMSSLTEASLLALRASLSDLAEGLALRTTVEPLPSDQLVDDPPCDFDLSSVEDPHWDPYAEHTDFEQEPRIVEFGDDVGCEYPEEYCPQPGSPTMQSLSPCSSPVKRWLAASPTSTAMFGEDGEPEIDDDVSEYQFLHEDDAMSLPSPPASDVDVDVFEEDVDALNDLLG